VVNDRARAASIALIALIALTAACTDDLVIRPIIDSPPPNSNADPYPALDEIELTIKVDGDSDPLVTAVFQRGQPLELRQVPYGQKLVLQMTGRISGSEVAYGRSCGFAITAGAAAPQPRLYFARTVKWADAADSTESTRSDGMAANYHDGSVLFLGGSDGDGTPLTAVDRFDPNLGRFDVLGQVASRRQARISALSDGRVLLAGGIDNASAQPATFLELIEFDTTPERRIERVPAAALAVVGHALSTLTDGRVIAFGGRDSSVVRNRVVELDSDGAGVALRTLRATLATPRQDHVATRLSDALGAPVLISGGRNGFDQVVAIAELYRPLSETFAPASEFAARMVVPRRNHHAVRLADDSVLIIGGYDGAAAPVATLELFSLERGFVDVGMIPADAGITGQSVTTLADGRVLITGGIGGGGAAVNTAYIVRVDPEDGSIDLIATDSLSTPRSGHQAILLCDGTVLVVGGNAQPSASERYNPPALGRR
jgi:hypothetical protein